VVRRLRRDGHGDRSLSELRRHAQYVRSNCPLCQKVASAKLPAAASTRVIEISEVGAEWSIDTAHLPPDKHGNKYLLVLVDSFSRWTEVKPVQSADADTAAQFLFEVAGRFGRPTSIRSDGGRQFDNHLLDAFMALLGVEKHTTLAYRPQANGRVERYVGEIKRHLRYIVLDRRLREDWSSYIPLIQRMVNTAPHAALGVSPAQLLFGNRVNLDRYLVPSAIPDSARNSVNGIRDEMRKRSVADYLDHMIEAQQAVRERAVDHQHQYNLKRLARFKPGEAPSFSVGDWVLASWPHGKKPDTLSVSWRGPFQIADHDSVRGYYTLQDPTDLELLHPALAGDRLRIYHMGLTNESNINDIVAADTDEAEVEDFVDHYMYECDAKGRLKKLKKHKWQFLARFVDRPASEDVWLSWAEADKLAALDRYSKLHPELEIPPDSSASAVHVRLEMNARDRD
jgi:transposase InsO family protein